MESPQNPRSLRLAVGRLRRGCGLGYDSSCLWKSLPSSERLTSQKQPFWGYSSFYLSRLFLGGIGGGAEEGEENLQAVKHRRV